jgi:hypothetical protein
MNTLKNFPTPDVRNEFERKARLVGHNNFSRRGELYCVSDLNKLAEGYCMNLPERKPVRGIVNG